MNHILTSWKSTLSGILTAIVGLSGLSIPAGLLTVKQALWWGIISAAARVILGCFTQDADKTMALVPGNPVPQAVDAHSMPDNPAATPVIK